MQRPAHVHYTTQAVADWLRVVRPIKTQMGGPRFVGTFSLKCAYNALHYDSVVMCVVIEKPNRGQRDADTFGIASKCASKNFECTVNPSHKRHRRHAASVSQSRICAGAGALLSLTTLPQLRGSRMLVMLMGGGVHASRALMLMSACVCAANQIHARVKHHYTTHTNRHRCVAPHASSGAGE